MGEYKPGDGELIFVFVHAFDECGKFLEAMRDSGKVPPGSELGVMHKRHSEALEKYKERPQEWFIAWRTERKGIDAVAKELMQNADLFELSNFSLAHYRVLQIAEVTKNMVNNLSASDATKALFSAVINGLPVRVDDVRRTGSVAAMNLLRLDSLSGRLDELMSGEGLAEQAGESTADRQGVKPIKWRGTHEQLKELAGQLWERGYIKESHWFVERFGSDCPPDVAGWEGKVNLLVYLLEQLQRKKLFVHVPQSRLESVFRIKNYKQSKGQYEINKSKKPAGAEEIDRILSSALPDS